MKKKYQKPQVTTVELGNTLVPLCTSPDAVAADPSEGTYDCFSVGTGSHSWVETSGSENEDDDF